MYRRLITLALGAMLVVALAVPAVAGPPAKTPVLGEDTLVQVLDPGRTWMSDGIQHVRGWTAEYETAGEPSDYIDGTSIIVANWNLDVTSGEGTMWGTIDLTLSDVDGGWRQTWVAKFDDFVWSGKAVGHGFGALRGMELRLDVQATGEGTDVFEGFIR